MEGKDKTILMTGDIVKLVDGDKECYLIVKGVLGSQVFFEDYGWVDRDLVRLVPLTVDFLKKNGFILSEYKNAMGFIYVNCAIFPKEGAVLSVQFVDNIPLTLIVKAMNIGIKKAVTYINELQHTIAYCGFNILLYI